MSAQGDCEFLVQRARELVQQDLWAAKAWLITARSLYPTDFNIQVRQGRALRWERPPSPPPPCPGPPRGAAPRTPGPFPRPGRRGRGER